MDFNSLANAGANVFLGGGSPLYDEDPRLPPVNAAVIELRRRGHSVAPSEGVPGLWQVSGMPELTTRQLIAAAFGSPLSTPPIP